MNIKEIKKTVEEVVNKTLNGETVEESKDTFQADTLSLVNSIQAIIDRIGLKKDDADE